MKQDIFNRHGVKIGEQFVDEPLPPPTHNRTPTPAQFIGLFSDTAWDDIKSHPSKKLKKWLDQIMTMSVVNLDDPIVTGGIAALESNTVITSTEAATILAGIPL